MESECSTCQFSWVGGVFHPEQFQDFFLFQNKLVYLTAMQAGGAGSLGTRSSLHVPAAQPAHPRGFLGQAQRHPSSSAPNLHLPVPNQPQALPKRLWSDNSMEQEAAHFQFITLLTGYIILPWKSLSALWHFTEKILQNPSVCITVQYRTLKQHPSFLNIYFHFLICIFCSTSSLLKSFP